MCLETRISHKFATFYRWTCMYIDISLGYRYFTTQETPDIVDFCTNSRWSPSTKWWPQKYYLEHFSFSQGPSYMHSYRMYYVCCYDHEVSQAHLFSDVFLSSTSTSSVERSGRRTSILKIYTSSMLSILVWSDDDFILCAYVSGSKPDGRRLYLQDSFAR